VATVVDNDDDGSSTYRRVDMADAAAEDFEHRRPSTTCI